MMQWVLSIVGMIFLDVVLETILPNGKMNGYIKGIFSIILLFVIINPLPKLFNKDINLNTTFEYIEDTSFLQTLNSKKLENYEIAIKKQLEVKGIEGINIQFEADITKSDLIIEKVYIDVCNIVLNTSDKHINISDTIIETVTNIINIDSKEVVIYGELGTD